MEIGNNERRMLRAMLSDPSKDWTLEELLTETGWDDQVHVAGSGAALEEGGLVSVTEHRDATVSLGEEGERASKEDLLEARIWDWLLSQKKEDRTMSALSSTLERHEAGPGVGLLKALGITLESGTLVIDDESGITSEIGKRSEFINSLSEGPRELSELDEKMISHFSGRKGLIVLEDRVSRTWALTKQGKGTDALELEDVEMIGEVTPELLQSEAWRDAEFKPFDVNAPAPTPSGGRPHPMIALIEMIRSIFLEMGFSEIEGDFIQSAGWNMDALFIPLSLIHI